jgi:hypothetical protein
VCCKKPVEEEEEEEDRRNEYLEEEGSLLEYHFSLTLGFRNNVFLSVVP